MHFKRIQASIINVESNKPSLKEVKLGANDPDYYYEWGYSENGGKINEPVNTTQKPSMIFNIGLFRPMSLGLLNYGGKKPSPIAVGAYISGNLGALGGAFWGDMLANTNKRV
jgi:hypothetical protein